MRPQWSSDISTRMFAKEPMILILISQVPASGSPGFIQILIVHSDYKWMTAVDNAFFEFQHDIVESCCLRGYDENPNCMVGFDIDTSYFRKFVAPSFDSNNVPTIVPGHVYQL